MENEKVAEAEFAKYYERLYKDEVTNTDLTQIKIF